MKYLFRQTRKLTSSMSLITAALLGSTAANADRELNDQQLRERMAQLDLRALEVSDAPDYSHLDEYVTDRESAIALGKALFWDMQAGGDGITACASCHFHAGADNRSKNQINPGTMDLRSGINPNEFNQLDSGRGGPNYQLVKEDFPLEKENNDVVSSQGVFLRRFEGFSSGPVDDCTSLPDATFHVGGINTRRVEPRNTPTVINAVLNHRNFWDGRANNIFNGVDPLGKRSNLINPEQGVWVQNTRRGQAVKVQLEIENSSLASQAVGPPLSAFEMSCGEASRPRSFPDLGRNMLRLRALASQEVASSDSVLGEFVHESGSGLIFTYAQLIRKAFHPKYWQARGRVGGTEFTQMEANFSLFWGLAIQLYEATLFSNQTPFDKFARGDNSALTDLEKEGLELFVGDGNCLGCHAGPEFTGASVRLREQPPVGKGEAVERMIMGNDRAALYDGGFYNIGVSATLADLGLGTAIGELDGRPIPLSFSRQLSEGPCVDLCDIDPVSEEPGLDGPIVPGERVAVDGAFKTPTVRNVELTAPFFHNGGHRTLEEVSEFYKDQGRTFFAEDNINDLDADMLNIDLGGGDIEPLVAFMKALTDERVRLEQAPFDHPSLRITNGHPVNETFVTDTDGNGEADDVFIDIPAVGAAGRAQPPRNFLE